MKNLINNIFYFENDESFVYVRKFSKNMNNIMKKNRDDVFDMARSLSILSIVCGWHLLDYLDNNVLSEGVPVLFSYLTYLSLATFSFMSSFFLKKYKIKTWSDAMSFYKRRFVRFWCLFFFALSSLYMASSAVGSPWCPSFANYLLSLVGLSAFFKPLPATLWYMVIMCFFYIITPPILAVQSRRMQIIVCVMASSIMVVFYRYGLVDERLSFYLPFYLLGLLLPDCIVSNIKRFDLAFFFLCLLFIIGLFNMGIKEYERLSLSVIGLPCILSLSSLLLKCKVPIKAASLISYSSMCMYFFHRHIFLFFVFLWNRGSGVALNEALVPIWLGVFVMIPSVILFSYAVQRIYDMLINRFAQISNIKY